MFKDYYQILNVDREATDEDIRKAYREMAFRYHPDRNEDPAAHQLFIEIKEAYETLINPVARSRFNSIYDRHYNTGKSSYVHVRTHSGSGYGRSKHRGRRYNRRAAPNAFHAPRRPAERPASMGEEYIFADKYQTERQAEVLGSRMGYIYFAMFARIAAVLTLPLSLVPAVDYALASRADPVQIVHVHQLPWSMAEPGVLRVQTAAKTFFVHRSHWDYVQEGKYVRLKKTPIGGYVTHVYADSADGRELAIRPFGGLYGATFSLVVILMILSVATIVTRENAELASYIGTVNLLLFVIIFGVIKNAG